MFVKENPDRKKKWKIQFNLDPSKQVNEVIFSRKSDSSNVFHSPIKFNNINIAKCPIQKHLGPVYNLISTPRLRWIDNTFSSPRGELS